MSVAARLILLAALTGPVSRHTARAATPESPWRVRGVARGALDSDAPRGARQARLGVMRAQRLARPRPPPPWSGTLKLSAVVRLAMALRSASHPSNGSSATFKKSGNWKPLAR